MPHWLSEPQRQTPLTHWLALVPLQATHAPPAVPQAENWFTRHTLFEQQPFGHVAALQPWQAPAEQPLAQAVSVKP
jgi:hypothetical protein